MILPICCLSVTRRQTWTCRRRCDGIPWPAFSFSHTASLFLTFLYFQVFFFPPHPFLVLGFFCFVFFYFLHLNSCLSGVGKWAEQSMWGSGGSFGAGRQSLCGAASWTYKEMGAGEVEKGEQCKGKRGVSGKLQGAWFLKVPRGRGARLSPRSCIQMHSSGTSGLPFTSSATSPLVCDMDTGPALSCSNNTKTSLHDYFYYYHYYS